jgi:hypothetical protein
MALPIGIPAAKTLGRALGTEEGLLSNAYKLNPYAFKANPEAYYHRSPNIKNIINKEKQILQGFGESKIGKELTEKALQPTKGINLMKGANSQLYFAKGVPLDYGRTNKIIDYKTGKLISGQGYPGPYIAEVEGVPMGASTKGKAPGVDVTNIGGYAVSRRPINLNEAKFYKEHWLQGYKEVPKQEDGGIIKDDRGQWDHPGEITEIGSNQITMQGVPYPVLGISDTGDVQMMYPEEEYEFDGEKVTEFPMAKNGRRQEQKGLQNLDNLLNFTNYNKPQPGGWLSKYE